MKKSQEQIAQDRQRMSELLLSLTNITPNKDQVERIEQVRAAAKNFGGEIINRAGNSRERSLALTHLEDATMWAVKAIVLERGE